MGGAFSIQTSNSLECLLDALARRLAGSPLPPLCAETIIVPGQGLARWLLLGLAQKHGVAASLALPFPGAFLQRLAGGERDGAFDRPALTFRIFRLLGEPRLARELGPAAAYCRDDPDQLLRLQLAERLAGCFDDYQLYRDDLLAMFERGQEPDLPHARWQGRLWQALLRDAGATAPRADRAAAPAGQRLLFPEASPPAPAGAHRLQELRHRLADPAAARAILPVRLSVFGIATLPPAFLELLLQIARQIEVVVYAPKPTPHYYGDARRPRGAPPGDVAHPLLAAWGQQSREFFDLVLDRDATGAAETPLEYSDPGQGCLLHALQSDLLHLVSRPEGTQRYRLDAGDASLRVHGAHSRLREMEVLKDQLLAAFAEDPTLTPADVLVLVPEIQDYAPYVHAVFRPLQHLLPFVVADRSPAADLPLAAAFVRLLGLARGRFTAPELLLLLEEPSLARTFGIASGDLGVLRAWVQRTRIRWGIDGEQRQRDLGLPNDDGNTWRQGLQRLLLGHLTGPIDRLVLGALPDADGSGARGALLGAFAAAVGALADVCRALGRPHTLSAWAAQIEQTLARLFTVSSDEERQGKAHLQSLAQQLRLLEEQARLREELSPAAFARWLDGALAARGEGRGFLGGAITFAALRPLRAVPSRVLAVSGLGEGAFPRRHRPQAFDLLGAARRPGDRDARADDRQLFLDALLAARDRLILTWVSRSQKDDSECAPSPLLSELFEHLDAACTPPPGYARARDFVFVQHPLQAWSPRYGGADPRLFTHDRPPVRRAAAPEAAPTAPAAPTAAAPELITLSGLMEFWRHPVKSYCRRVLQVRFLDDDDRDDDAEPFTLHSLDRYQWIERSVRAALAGVVEPKSAAALQQSGMLPLGALGRLEQLELTLDTERFLLRARARVGKGTAAVQVAGADYVVRGEFTGLGQDELVLCRAARIKPKDRLRAWIHHVLLCAAADQGAQVPRRTTVLGLDGESTAESLSPALPELDRLVAGYRQGRRAPMPFFEHASTRYARDRLKDLPPAEALRAARKQFDAPGYEDDPGYQHDLPDPWIEFCFRDRDPLALPEFAALAEGAYGSALAFFDPEHDSR